MYLEKLKLNLDFLDAKSQEFSRKIKLRLSPDMRVPAKKLSHNKSNQHLSSLTVRPKFTSPLQRSNSKENKNASRFKEVTKEKPKQKPKRLKLNFLYQNLLKINKSPRSTSRKSKESLNNRTMRKPSNNSLTTVSRNKLSVIFHKLKNKHQMDFEITESPSHQILNQLIQQYEKYDPRKVVGFCTKPIDLRTDFMLTQNSQILQFLKGKSVNLEALYADLLPAKKRISFSNFKVIKCIGAGGFAKVFLVRSKLDGKFYAMKLIEKKLICQQRRETIIQIERDIMQNIQHPFLMQLQVAFESADFIVFIMQYCPGGQFFTYIKKYKRLDEQTARFYLVQILLAIDHLHSKNIIYRDIKPQNILLDLDGHVRVSDFGLSKPGMSKEQKAYSFCGSPEYMSPQMILKEGHTFTVDYYCLGALLYQMVTGLPPFYSRNTEQIYQSVVNQELSFPKSAVLTNQIKNLMKSLLNKNPKMRLGSLFGVKEIMAHPWFGKIKKQDYLNKLVQPPIIINCPENLTFDFSAHKEREDSWRQVIQLQQRQTPFRPIFSDRFYFKKNGSIKPSASKLHPQSGRRK